MPRYGFNFQWMYSFEAQAGKPREPDLKALDFLAAEGFDFVRIPTDYRFWTRGQDYLSMDEGILAYLDRYLEACSERGLHMCLNAHRAPGYCINRPEIEPHNLWTDSPAQEGFLGIWAAFARRWRGVAPERLSFDLLNEPPAPGQLGMSRRGHEELMRAAMAAIRAQDPERPIVIDGLGGGNMAMPELADSGAVHSGRGYQPMALTHYQASWCAAVRGLPRPVYPGTEWEGRTWDRHAIKEYYGPWRAVEAMGVEVHIGEFGCYRTVSQAPALRWLEDLMSIYAEFGWGYSLWEFEGSFGIIGHGRPGGRYELYRGYMVDRRMLELYASGRAKKALDT
jgi:aryl-phospho-beta-D-glucosidase BglC (GH1 family)